MRDENWHLLDTHFNWDRFAEQVEAAAESSASPDCHSASLSHTLQIRYAEMTSPFWRDVMSPGKLYRRLRKVANAHSGQMAIPAASVLANATEKTK